MRKNTVFVLGLGKSGRGVTRLLINKGYQVVAFDDYVEDIHVRAFIQSMDPRFFTIATDDEALNASIGSLVVSPGISHEHPFYIKAKALQIDILGELEQSFRWIHKKTIGITGTKGKTTLTDFIDHLFKKNGIRSKALGNIGEPVSEYVLGEQREDVLIIEMSSFQLETMQSKCLDAALITNISPDHLDRYPNFEGYALTKLHIQKLLKNKAPLILSKSVVEQFSKSIDHNVIKIIDGEKAQSENAKYLQIEEHDYEKFFSSFSKWGPPRDCIAMAIEIAKMFNISSEVFKEALGSYKRLPHRLEFVDSIRGVHFYNDSKATNVESVIYAVHTLDAPIILIAGGKDKGFGFEKWKSCLFPKVRKVFVFGQTASKIYETLKDYVDIEIASDLKTAVALAFNLAKEHDNVLLSPGCSSFDMFESYEHRGNCFKQLVLHMK